MQPNANAQSNEIVIRSAEWLCLQVEREAILQGAPLDSAAQILRASMFSFSEREVPAVTVFHNQIVNLVRAAVIRAKAEGVPTIKVRDGLRLPTEWQDHYEVVFVAELPWLIAFAVQNAFMGNPLAGEKQPWKSDRVFTQGAKKAAGWGVAGAILATLLGG